MTAGDWIDGFLQRERLPQSYRDTIRDICGPLAATIERAAEHASGNGGGTLQVGLCGAQGSGKSTLAAALVELLRADGLAAASLSIDDFYLTHAARSDLARSVHPLLQTRGVPGTHEVPLALATLGALRRPGVIALPAFDKQVDDRRATIDWPRVAGPLRVTLLEGWCVGARPEADTALAQPLNTLESDEDPDGRWRGYVNRCLAGNYQQLFGELDLLLLLQAPSFDVVYGWRLEQERKLRARVAATGGDVSRVMDDAGVARFISHYERITRHILAEMPARADVVIELDAARAPLRLLARSG
ncbi:MAG: kinase [Pseudomonadota bacterium]